MRSIWNGTILFGEVAIPVGLVPTRRDGGIGFRQLHRDCGMPLTTQLVCPIHGALEDADIVKGYELAEGQYVALEADELEAIAPQAGKQIPLQAFVPADELDELAAEASYFLKPAANPIGQRAYVLLAGVLRETTTVAIARLVAFGSEWIVGVRPLGRSGPTMILQRLVPATDRVDPGDLEQLLAGVAVTDQEADLGRQLGSRLGTHLAKQPTLLEHTHRERVAGLVEAKLAGNPLVVAPRVETNEAKLPTADLADALARSISATRKPRAKKPARSKR